MILGPHWGKWAILEQSAHLGPFLRSATDSDFPRPVRSIKRLRFAATMFARSKPVNWVRILQRWSFPLPFGEWHSRMVRESLRVCHSPWIFISIPIPSKFLGGVSHSSHDFPPNKNKRNEDPTHTMTEIRGHCSEGGEGWGQVFLIF